MVRGRMLTLEDHLSHDQSASGADLLWCSDHQAIAINPEES